MSEKGPADGSAPARAHPAGAEDPHWMQLLLAPPTTRTEVPEPPETALLDQNIVMAGGPTNTAVGTGPLTETVWPADGSSTRGPLIVDHGRPGNVWLGTTTLPGGGTVGVAGLGHPPPWETPARQGLFSEEKSKQILLDWIVSQDTQLKELRWMVLAQPVFVDRCNLIAPLIQIIREFAVEPDPRLNAVVELCTAPNHTHSPPVPAAALHDFGFVGATAHVGGAPVTAATRVYVGGSGTVHIGGTPVPGPPAGFGSGGWPLAGLPPAVGNGNAPFAAQTAGPFHDPRPPLDPSRVTTVPIGDNGRLIIL